MPAEGEVVDGPVDRLDHGPCRATWTDHLPDQGAANPASHANAAAVHVAPEDGAGAVGAVAVHVLVGAVGEVPRYQLDALERGMVDKTPAPERAPINQLVAGGAASGPVSS